MKTEQQIIDELKSLQKIAEYIGCPLVVNNEHMARIFKEALGLIGDQAMSIKGLKNKIENISEKDVGETVDDFKNKDWANMSGEERVQFNMNMLLNRAKTNGYCPKFMVFEVMEQAVDLDLKKSEHIKLADEGIMLARKTITHLKQLLERQAEEIEQLRTNASPFAGVVAKPHPSLVMTSEFSKKIFEDTQKKVIGDIKEQIKGLAAKAEVEPDALTVRDQFAMAALTGLISKTPLITADVRSKVHQYKANSIGAYAYADAMMEVRAAQEPKQGDDGWIEYNGGGCPVDPRVMVECKYIDEQQSNWAVPAFQIDWESRALPITHYRLAK